MKKTYFISLTLLAMASITNTQAATSEQFVGAYTHGDVDSQEQLFLLSDKTFCYTFMGGALDLLVGGRWQLENTQSNTITLKEIRAEQPIYPTFGKTLDRLGAQVEFWFDGYSLSNAYSPVFALSSTDVQPTAFRPLFPVEESSWASSCVLPLTSADKAKYFFIGDMELDAYNQPTRLRIAQYKLEKYDTISLGFNNRQTTPPMNMSAKLNGTTLMVNGNLFGSKKSLPLDAVKEIQENCISPALHPNKANTSQSQNEDGESESHDLLSPIKVFYLDVKAISGKPFFDKKDHDAPTPNDPVEAAIIYEHSLLQTAFGKISSDSKNIDNFYQTAKDVSERKQRINKHAPLLADLFAKLVVSTNVKGDLKATEKTFFYFMENIYPAIANVNNEAMNYSVSVIASQGLAIAILLKNDNISNLIFTKLLATNFDIKTHKNSTLIYNLACYYATHENKTALFEAVKQARLRGKPAAQFMEDSDFKNYLSDKDFLAALR